MRPTNKRSTARRGAEAVEFAMVMPVMLMLVFGGIDYGWYFWTQALAANACLTGMRLGGMVRPEPNEIEDGNSCDGCITRAGIEIGRALDNVGVDHSTLDLEPELVGIDGNCALLLDINIPYQPITPRFIPVPTSYNVALHVVAQGAHDCT